MWICLYLPYKLYLYITACWGLLPSKQSHVNCTGSPAECSFIYWRSLPNCPLSISFDYPHAKIQVPQETNTLSQNNYKMLDATVNTTSVTVTVCICHEMRQKQNEFALMHRIREEAFLCCLLTVLSAFVPTSPQMSVNVSHGICCRRKQICMRASCFDKMSLLPSPLSVQNTRDISPSLLHFFASCFVFHF